MEMKENLPSAQPHLIYRTDFRGDRQARLTPYIGEAEPGCDQVIREGYDPFQSVKSLSPLLATEL
jgi:hypothetical protein